MHQHQHSHLGNFCYQRGFRLYDSASAYRLRMALAADEDVQEDWNFRDLCGGFIVSSIFFASPNFPEFILTWINSVAVLPA